MKRIIFLVFGLMLSGFSIAQSATCTLLFDIATHGMSRSQVAARCPVESNGRFLYQYSAAGFSKCADISTCKCPSGYQPSNNSNGIYCQPTSAPSSSSASSVPSSCPDGQVKNIVTGECEAMTQCTYPQLYNTLDNSCRPNESNCAINTVPIPFSDACNVIATPQCPSGWILSDVTGAHCLPDPDAPPTSSAPSEEGSSSSPSDSSSAPSSSPPASSAPSSIGQTSSSGNGGDGDGSGGNSGGDGDGGGSNSSSNGGGNGGGSGAGECDPTARNYFDCIAGPTQAYVGLGQIYQSGGFKLQETEQLLQQKKTELQTVMNEIRGEAQNLFNFNVNAGVGSLTDTCLQIFGVEVCFGWAKFSQYLSLLGQVIFFVCAFVAFAIVVRR